MADASQMPPSPMTALAEAAAQQHELYLAYIAAGFTASQAMQIICAMVAAVVTQQAGQQPPTQN